MMNSEEQRARQERRRQLIDRLNQKEEMLAAARPARRVGMSEEELEAAIERERNDWRNGFGSAGAG